MLTSERVYEIAQKLNESKVETNPEVETKDTDNTETNETTISNSDDKNVVDSNTNSTEKQETSEENVDKSKEKSNSEKRPTHEEQERYAFTKLKNKERQKREKLEARIKELEEINKKYAGLDLQAFDNDQSKYTDYLVSQKMNELEKTKLLEMKQQSQQAEYDAINEQRIMNCFPDEKERDIYNKLIDEHASDFVKLLDKADPEGVVLGYLDDCEISPLLIRVMMTKPDFRNEILSKTNPYTKLMAMKSFEDRIANAVRIVENKKSKKEKSIPVVGSVTKSESTQQIDKNDPNYFENKLKEMNRLRGRR